MPVEWHIFVNGEKRGPYTSVQLKEFAADSKLAAHDLIWKEGMAQPVKAAKVSGLFAKPPSRPSNAVPPPLPIGLTPSALVVDALPPTLPTAQPNQLQQHKKGLASRLKEAAMAVAASAKATAKMTAAKLDEIELVDKTLPRCYSALGQDIYDARRFEDAFAEVYLQIDASKQQIAELQKPSAPPVPETLGGKVKVWADNAERESKSGKVAKQIKTLARQLGKQVYDKHHSDSGPPELVNAIEDNERKLSDVRQRIASLKSEASGRLRSNGINPYWFIGGSVTVVFIAIWLVLARSGSRDGKSQLPSSPTSSTQTAERRAKSDSNGDPTVDFHKLDFKSVNFAKGPQGQPVEEVRRIDRSIGGEVTRSYKSQDGKEYRHGIQEFYLATDGRAWKFSDTTYVFGSERGWIQYSETGIRVQESIYENGEYRLINRDKNGVTTYDSAWSNQREDSRRTVGEQ